MSIIDNLYNNNNLLTNDSLFNNNNTFNNLGRIGDDMSDKTQKNIFNYKYSNYTLSNFYNDDNDKQINFMSQQPTIMINSKYGISNYVIDDNSNLLLNTKQERTLEKLNVQPRIFNTVPYLGRGSCNPVLESKLLQGQHIFDKKSVSTIMEETFMNHILQPNNEENENYIEENIMDNWVRGGQTSRRVNY